VSDSSSGDRFKPGDRVRHDHDRATVGTIVCRSDNLDGTESYVVDWPDVGHMINKAFLLSPTAPESAQVGGDHYTRLAVQPWDALEAWLTPEELRGYHKGVIVAYLAREHGKGGDEDIRKAASHFAKLLECLESKS